MYVKRKVKTLKTETRRLLGGFTEGIVRVKISIPLDPFVSNSLNGFKCIDSSPFRFEFGQTV